jgi:GNAT superfamily N-acetyltransferase
MEVDIRCGFVPAQLQVARELLNQAAREHIARYGAASAATVDAAGLTFIDDVLNVAWLGSSAVGCCGLGQIDIDTAEVRRLYVSPACRGRGIARMLLAGVEAAARSRSFSKLILVTGTKQPEAEFLYRSVGYRDRPPYGAHPRLPDAQLAIYLEKHLTTRGAAQSARRERNA